MSVGLVTPHLTKLVEDFTLIGIAAGRFAAQVSNLKEKVPNLLNQDEKLTQLFTVAKKAQAEHDANFMKLSQTINQMKAGSIATPLQAQVKEVSQSFTLAKEELKEAFHLAFKQTLEQGALKVENLRDCLNSFRNAPTEENRLAAKKEGDEFKTELERISTFPKRCSIVASVGQQVECKSIAVWSKIFDSLIDIDYSKKEMPSLMNRLMMLSHCPEVQAKITFERECNEYISDLDKAFQNALDGNVYALSPEPKGGEEWGKHNRYANLSIFKRALAKTTKECFEFNMRKEGIKDSQMNAMYSALHIVGLGPLTEDAAEWVQRELPSVLGLLEFVSDQDIVEIEKELNEGLKKE